MTTLDIAYYAVRFLWAVCLCFVLLLFTIPLVAHVLVSQEKRKRLEAAEHTRCSACGGILGAEAIRLADAAWDQYVAKLREENPGVRFRLVRTLDAICPHCGARYRYAKDCGAFQAESLADPKEFRAGQ